jgi:hypothetical protein
MHLELVIPGLFQGQASAPALEMLLARGRRSASRPATLEDWYARAFGLESEPLPAGALTALACGLEPGTAHWMRADPVHLRADRDQVLLFPSQAFSLAPEEAEPLAATLNLHYAGEFTVHAVRPDAWCLRGGRDLPVGARPPVEIAGRSIDAELPDKRWHALLNEIQMALYQHAVNTARDARGDPVVNGLWLWGGGTLPAAASVSSTADWDSLSADDPVALGLARLAGLRHRAPGPDAALWLERAPEDGRHLVVLEALRGASALGEAEALDRGLRELEARWFAPLLAALRAGRVGMLTVHVPEAGAAFETARGDLRRFWRRPRALAEYRDSSA